MRARAGLPWVSVKRFNNPKRVAPRSQFFIALLPERRLVPPTYIADFRVEAQRRRKVPSEGGCLRHPAAECAQLVTPACRAEASERRRKPWRRRIPSAAVWKLQRRWNFVTVIRLWPQPAPPKTHRAQKRLLPKFTQVHPEGPCRGRWTPINADESMGPTSPGRRGRIGTSRIAHQMPNFRTPNSQLRIEVGRSDADCKGHLCQKF